jgi:hypothetical protein
LRNITLSTLLLFCLLAAVPANAKARQTVSRKATPSGKKVSSVSGKKSAVKSSSKGKTSKRRGVQTARAIPRQSEPTPERYMQIQQALVDKGYHPGPVSGQWGSEWVAALKQFQQAQNLNADGKLGALSLIALGLGPKREPLTQFAGKPESIQ